MASTDFVRIGGFDTPDSGKNHCQSESDKAMYKLNTRGRQGVHGQE
jgi:hypothetical protein